MARHLHKNCINRTEYDICYICFSLQIIGLKSVVIHFLQHHKQIDNFAHQNRSAVSCLPLEPCNSQNNSLMLSQLMCSNRDLANTYMDMCRDEQHKPQWLNQAYYTMMMIMMMMRFVILIADKSKSFLRCFNITSVHNRTGGGIVKGGCCRLIRTCLSYTIVRLKKLTIDG